ncbi:uncharacterized protein LOC111697839 [Eurytemora carolleeae]|uniref:uncharacterized protein LOC111697839 n=1 Tax=Eurytemora carolleeae TaxID=1294199 RepID=UPI000C77F51B|nr:uncharacterized protein LOC111697839 [Eurytemora carolleeae]|eukprot:XP_023323739.1 uncharacterized protein LOC111697839 [Eurytemora affinis]
MHKQCSSEVGLGGRMPVSCYICGRDFGTRSISIHIPSCQKKWEIEQNKLPRHQRRPPPQAPQNLEKVISGELSGAELNKFNADALRDWNDAALLACEFCSRTFLPASLKFHQKLCTEDRPMIKISKESTYASKAESKVNYPKLRKNKKSEPGTPDPCNSVKCNVNHEDPFEHMKGAEGRDSPLEAEGGDTETDTEDNVSTTQLIEHKPALTNVEPKPARTKIDHKPALPKVEHKPALTKIGHKPALTKIGHKPAHTKVEHKPALTKVEHKCALTKIEHKPSLTKIEHK